MPFQCVERFARATTVAFTEHLCASASASGRRVRVWERESGREILLLDKLRYMYTCFLTPDESACVVCGTVNTVLLCSLGEEKPAVQKIVLKGDEGPDAACCLAPDGSALYYPMTTGSLGTQVLKIDVRSGEVRSLCETETMVRWLSWIPEREQYLLLGFDRAREQNYFLWFKNDRIDMRARVFLQEDARGSLHVIYGGGCLYAERRAEKALGEYDLEGRLTRTLPLPASINAFPEPRENPPPEAYLRTEILHTLLCDSAQNRLYVATSNAVYALSTRDGAQLAAQKQEFGYLRLALYGHDLLASRFSGGVERLRLAK